MNLEPTRNSLGRWTYFFRVSSLAYPNLLGKKKLCCCCCNCCWHDVSIWFSDCLSEPLRSSPLYSSFPLGWDVLAGQQWLIQIKASSSMDSAWRLVWPWLFVATSLIVVDVVSLEKPSFFYIVFRMSTFSTEVQNCGFWPWFAMNDWQH